MVQAHACVSVHCHQCGDTPAGPGFDAHYPSEDAALEAVAVAGWVLATDGRLLCSCCGPVLVCEAVGHDFTAWHRPAPSTGHGPQMAHCGCDPRGRVHRVGSAECWREFRYCRRCCLHESRTQMGVA